jgi:DNA mismatch repair protein MutL
MPIKVLSDDLASRIAAGEVVERPASVIKELVENSIDAGSSRVVIELVDGGAKSITVTDNGHGIPAGELPFAFERFATSKIDENSDLIAIGTLGFRGEALPSIASVSRVTAVSRSVESDSGARLVIDFGDKHSLEKTGAPVGTRIQVDGLFQNVPARLKFMGSPGKEVSRVQAMLGSLALVYPDIAFTLVSDSRERLKTTGTGKLEDAVRSVYGSKIADQMLSLEPEEQSAFSVDGLISSPSINRSNRNYITLAVNGRTIQSRRLTYAVEQAYHGFLPERRFPIAVVRIQTPLSDVDANVHPAKSEVRFLREDLVYALVQRSIRGLLNASAPVHELGIGRTSGVGLLRPVGGSTPGSRTAMSSGSVSTWPTPEELVQSALDHENVTKNESSNATESGSFSGTPRETLPVLRVVGQTHETYIVCEGPDGIYLVDQHAAHERVTYDQLQDTFSNRSPDSQALLEPAVIELAPGMLTVVQEHLEELGKVGWDAEIFGANSIVIRSIPGALSTRASSDGAGQVFINVLDELTQGGTGQSWVDRMLATVACHSSVRAGQTLPIEDAKSLLRQLEKTTHPNTCPHGRPTLIQLSVNDLEREFKRR